MIEVEIKTRLSDEVLTFSSPECMSVCAKIEGLGYKNYVAQGIVDTYYDTPDDCLTGRGLSLRIREYKYGDIGKNYLCFKGQKLTGKSREESDVEVGPGIHKVLQGLGYKQVATVNKRRRKYDLDGVDICLDAVDGLGTFLEIEAMSEPERVRENLIHITELMRRLGYTELIDDSYLEQTLGK